MPLVFPTLSLMLARRSEYHWQMLGEHVTPHSPTVQNWLAVQGMTIDDPAAAAVLTGQVMRQAMHLAFGDMFVYVAITVVILAPVVILLRRTTKPATQPAE